uniref:Uncharacterized protein n=1 Tax=viral metagenome TaxID=1070528 RepID=A0A6C0JUT9_9ZZZZ
MYIIISNSLRTNELFTRAQFAGRIDARKNLLKEAQAWLSTFKPGQDWEILVHKKDMPKDTKIRYFVKHSNKNEDVLVVYERTETIIPGWFSNTTVSTLVKIMIFTVVEISKDFTSDDRQEIRFVSAPVVSKEENSITFTNQKLLMADLKQTLSERRLVIE